MTEASNSGVSAKKCPLRYVVAGQGTEEYTFPASRSILLKMTWLEPGRCPVMPKLEGSNTGSMRWSINVEKDFSKLDCGGKFHGQRELEPKLEFDLRRLLPRHTYSCAFCRGYSYFVGKI